MSRTVLVLCTAAMLATANPVSPAAADDHRLCGTVMNDDGIAACTRLIRRIPKDAAAYDARGNGDKFLGDFDRAIAGYDRQVRVAADKYAAIGALKSRANASMAKGDYDSAIADYGEVIRLTPDSALAYIDRGQD